MVDAAAKHTKYSVSRWAQQCAVLSKSNARDACAEYGGKLDAD